MTTMTTTSRWHHEYQRRTGEDRDRFLTHGRPPRAALAEIAESWRRSARLGVDPAGLNTSFGPTRAEESDLLHSIDEVLRGQAWTLSGEPVSMIFAAPSGRILRRYCPNPGLANQLENVFLAPGASYEESRVGTNGIGTALERAKPTLVVGGEHFSEQLGIFACAGAPVHHPVSGALLGVVDITCRATDVNGLLLSTAQLLARQIQDELLRSVSSRELTLLSDYLTACRNAAGPIVAVNDEIVMMNRHAQQKLAPDDRAALLSCTANAADKPSPHTLVADLPSGLVVRMDYRPSLLSDSVVGGVFRVHLAEQLETAAEGVSVRVSMPGLVGASAQWQRVCSQARDACRSTRWLVLEGEAGVGKASLARAVHHSSKPGEHLRVIDLAADVDPDVLLREIESELVEGEGTLLLSHLERIPEPMVSPLAELLVEYREGDRVGRTQWVAATRDNEATRPDVDSALIPCFARTVVVPPLRHRSEDIPLLATCLLRRLSSGREVTFSSAALRHLARLPLPGNGHQLSTIVRDVLRTTRAGAVELDDLPPQCRSTSRRSLTPLESLERDAIVQALADHAGNKTDAAGHLGMSRATIYRKIRDYGIT